MASCLSTRLQRAATTGHLPDRRGPARSIRSDPFVLGDAVYSSLAARELGFLRAQRDGSEVDSSLLARRPAHLADASASVYKTPAYRNETLLGGLTPLGGPPVDVAGGWSDAGDYLKFVETASFVENMLLYTIREYPAALGAAEPRLLSEARFGLSWLARMWDQQTGVLRYQVGIGTGNKRIEGDHDVGWRLPQRDETLRAKPGAGAYYVRHRPVFQDGSNERRSAPTSPAGSRPRSGSAPRSWPPATRPTPTSAWCGGRRYSTARRRSHARW